MTDTTRTTGLAQVRAEARSMTLDDLRAAHGRAMAMFCRSTTPEAAQYAHDLAGEYAEAYQNAMAAGR